jgi:hypothetical protein
VPVPGPGGRYVGIDREYGTFVVFNRDNVGSIHGFYVTWNQLHQDMRNALHRAGLVNAQTGRIYPVGE